MTTFFISDIHISEQYPEIGEQLIDFLENQAQQSDALYILGDLFEYWLGDDDTNPEYKKIQSALKLFTDKKTPTYFIHGNRDFLIGETFAHETGIKILSDPSIIELYGERILISHGDIFCTDDVEYQSSRKQTRDPNWQKMILEKPLKERKVFANEAREKSSIYTQKINEVLMDVNQSETNKTFEKYGLNRIIHGHTHKPAIHNSMINGELYKRIVLGDWYEQGSVLKWDQSGPELVTLNRAP